MSGIGEDRFEDGFEFQEDRLLVLAPGCARDGFHDLETAGRSCCGIGDVRGEGEERIKCDTEDSWVRHLLGGSRA